MSNLHYKCILPQRFLCFPEILVIILRLIFGDRRDRGSFLC
ncbi:hypothetical protein [Cylindrospermum stagnale]|nr:hypothetical protein [Cylindrospermum stagnale]